LGCLEHHQAAFFFDIDTDIASVLNNFVSSPAITRGDRLIKYDFTVARLLCLATLLAFAGCSPDAREASSIDGATESAELSRVEADPTPDLVPQPSTANGETNEALRSMQQIMGDLQAGRFEVARNSLMQRLVSDPEDLPAQYQLGLLSLHLGQTDAGIALLEGIPLETPQFGITAKSMLAQRSTDLGEYSQALRHYLEIEQRYPKAAIAHRKLAWLYNRSGRRHLAITHLRRLCMLGDVQQDELFAMLSLTDAIYVDPKKKAPGATTDTRYFGIGPFARARWLYGKFRFLDALEPVRDANQLRDATPDMKAFAIRVLASAQHIDEAKSLAATSAGQLEKWSDYWAAAAIIALDERDFEGGARAALECIRRDPTDFRTILRLHHALDGLGQHEQKALWWDRHVLTRESITLGVQLIDAGGDDAKIISRLSNVLEQLNRPLEAVMWQAIAIARSGSPTLKQSMAELNRRRLNLVESSASFPDKSFVLCGADPTRYTMPAWLKFEGKDGDALAISNLGAINGNEKPRLFEVSSDSPSNVVDPIFSNIANSAGLKTTYRVADRPQSDNFAMYQQGGGGVATLDYDLNGMPDLFLAQGGGWAKQARSGFQSDLLYRNVSQPSGDVRVVDITEPANIRLNAHTFGVSSGDINQDGFDDLACGTMEGTRIWINQGDGSFKAMPVIEPEQTAGPIMRSSLGIADVTGDGLMDVFQVNYLSDPGMILPAGEDALGKRKQLSPLDYGPAADHLFAGNQRGIGPGVQVDSVASPGLGLLIAGRVDFACVDPARDESSGLDNEGPGSVGPSLRPSVFVANDVTPDQLLLCEADGATRDSAILTGCAMGARGKPSGSMGIAHGDFDGTGSLDLFVTNFEDESNSLFLQKRGAFLERSVVTGINQISDPFVGFGTQAIDYDNDGSLELMVANGRVELPVDEHLYQQPTQLMRWTDQGCVLAEVNDESGYFDSGHLGRAVSRLDVNADGKSDLVITHLEEPPALILNGTDSPNRSLGVILKGVADTRDAIGAVVTVVTDRGRRSQWVTAGDGYMCRNEPVSRFGIKARERIDRFEVVWPNGQVQRVAPVKQDGLLLIVQGLPAWQLN
jgi:tetratricopeptide (TPR) repeat protein